MSLSPDHPRSLPQRLTERLAGWAARRHGPDHSPVELVTSRIYIVPTGFGITYAVGVFIMLLAAMNYNNSLAFLLTFFLTATGLVAMHLTHSNLANIELRFAGSESAFAGEPVSHEWILYNPSARMRFDIRLRCEHDGHVVDVDSESGCRVRLYASTQTRGNRVLPRLRVSSRFPLGLFHAWSWVNTPQAVTVWPRPAVLASIPLQAGAADDGDQHTANGDDDFDGLTDYQPGDSMHQIAWKTLASKNVLATRRFAGSEGAPLWLRFVDLTQAELEDRVSVLTRAVLDCAEQQRSFGLDLGAAILEPGFGEQHVKNALDLLAFHGLAGDT